LAAYSHLSDPLGAPRDQRAPVACDACSTSDCAGYLLVLFREYSGNLRLRKAGERRGVARQRLDHAAARRPAGPREGWCLRLRYARVRRRRIWRPTAVAFLAPADGLRARA